jgi:hypothetical protein
MSSFKRTKAPEMLLDKIALLEGILEKSKYKGLKSETLEVYQSIADTMKYAYDFLKEMEWMYERTKMILEVSKYYKERVEFLEKEMSIYIAIEEAMIEGDLEERVERVNTYLKRRSQLTGERENNLAKATT